MRRFIACFVVLLFACDDDDTPSPREDAAVDGGLDSGLDGGRDGGGDAARDTPRDAQLDGRVEGDARVTPTDASVVFDARVAQELACDEQRAFLAAHRACTRDDECVITGACSGGFGFQAVTLDAKAQAQAYSDGHACSQVYDGPMYNAVCEQGTCVERENGHACGRVTDAGGPDVCSANQELYRKDCDSPWLCRQRCTGTSDTACGSGASCKLESVSRSTERYDIACAPKLELWLCSAP